MTDNVTCVCDSNWARSPCSENEGLPFLFLISFFLPFIYVLRWLLFQLKSFSFTFLLLKEMVYDEVSVWSCMCDYEHCSLLCIVSRRLDKQSTIKMLHDIFSCEMMAWCVRLSESSQFCQCWRFKSKSELYVDSARKQKSNAIFISHGQIHISWCSLIHVFSCSLIHMQLQQIKVYEMSILSSSVYNLFSKQ